MVKGGGGGERGVALVCGLPPRVGWHAPFHAPGAGKAEEDDHKDEENRDD